jgi:hypothetical protein
MRQPGQAGAGVDRPGGIEEAERLQRAGAEDGDGDGERPHPHARPVADVHRVGDRAHGAEAGALAGGAEHGADREAEPDDGRGGDEGVVHGAAGAQVEGAW